MGRSFGTPPIFINCVISDNLALKRGGGVAMDMKGEAWFIDTVFSGNSCTEGKGGALYDDFGSSPYIVNCLFNDNFAQSGAAIANDGTSCPVIYQSTFYHNEASEAGGALYQGSGEYNDPTIINCIIWGNVCLEDEASIYNWNDCYPVVSHSVVEGGYTGSDIFNTDPRFTDADKGDFTCTAEFGGEEIGYDSSIRGKRSDKDIAKLQSSVAAVKATCIPEIPDLDNHSGEDSSLVDCEVLYVSPEGNGRGRSWSDASGSIQDMIDQAAYLSEKHGKDIQVWIAAGEYLAGEYRSDSIILRSGVELFGGFAGSEESPNDRNLKLNKTIISGDIGVKGVPSDNTYHVFIGADDAILDGLTITGGYADGVGGQVYDNKGGAVLNYYGGYRIRPTYEPTLGFDDQFRNCVFTGNYAVEGGAVYTYDGGNPRFENCEFNGNSAVYGGATVDRGGVNSHYENCTFSGNKAAYKGGALFVDYGSMATVSRSLFSENCAGTSGGAFYVIDRASQEIPNPTDIKLVDSTWKNPEDIFSSVLVEDSRFENNRAEVDGGVFYIYEKSNLKILDSSFNGNRVERKGDIAAMINQSRFYDDGGNSFSPAGIYFDDSSGPVK